MPKFSGTVPPTTGVGPITVGTVADKRTFEGAVAFSRTAKSDLFLFGVSNMVGEQTFYEGAGTRDMRFVNLVAQVTREDPQWVFDYATWLRDKANMRSASIVVAATVVKTALTDRIKFVPHTTANDGRSLSRAIIDAVCRRADEPAEFIGYWFTTYGRNLPMPVKRGVADAVRRLYTENSALRYDGETRDLRMADVIELSHPKNRGTWQGALYEYLLTKRHGRKEIDVEPLPLIAARMRLQSMPVEQRRALINRGDETARTAGFSWEALSGWLADGKGMDAMAWEYIIPEMGYMALLRNLRNFDQAGITAETVEAVKARLTDPDEVARSRQLPFRFYSAYQAVAGTRWLDALETALGLSLQNVPSLRGRTLVLIDRSDSMTWHTLSEHSNVDWADAAALFGTAFAARAEKADLVEFGSTSKTISFSPVAKGGSVLRTLGQFQNLGGTQTRAALQRHYAGHDRVLLVTDEQSGSTDGVSVYRGIVPEDKTCITINMLGYDRAHAPTGGKRHVLGGLSDASFTVLPLLERGRDAGWPWEDKQG